MPSLIGRSPNQVPVNGMLGTAAFIDVQQIPQYIQSSYGLVPIVSLTPTAVVNLDFLTLFTSQYDNYLIIGEGIKFAADDAIYLRVAVAGAAVTTGYYLIPLGGGSSSANTTAIPITGGDMRTAGAGSTFCINILNANDVTQVKMIDSNSVYTSTVAGPIYSALPQLHAGTFGIITGFRLYSFYGSNFSTQGKIRVFGYNNV